MCSTTSATRQSYHAIGERQQVPQPKLTRFCSRNIHSFGICHQFYVDIVGSGLLYKSKQLRFSQGLLLNYLWVVCIPKKLSHSLAKWPSSQPFLISLRTIANSVIFKINPVHRHSIRSIHMHFKVTNHDPSFSIPAKAIGMLAKLQGLQNLELEAILDWLAS
jgi:hypothetical protein